jgi:EipB-like
MALKHAAAGSVLFAALILSAPAFADSRLLPHRAVYDLELVQSKGDQSVGEAMGRIAFEFTGNACDGYVLNFRQVLRINDQDTGERVFDTRNMTWEDGEAKSFRFDAERKINSATTEAGKGRAERSEDGALAVEISRPERKKSDLAGPVYFPTQQLIAILDAAKAGKLIFESKVFDGSDGSDKVYETTAVIGKELADGGKGLDPTLADRDFGGLKRWPITISYFDTGAGERQPLSVISYDLLENGVMNRMRIDFGEFALAGRPTQMEPLQVEPCDK